MECSVISRTLDLVLGGLNDGQMLPRSLVIAADNTTREAKNQYFQMFLAYLKASKKFEAIDCEFQTVGHTHNEQDQRFDLQCDCGTVRSRIQCAPVAVAIAIKKVLSDSC